MTFDAEKNLAKNLVRLRRKDAGLAARVQQTRDEGFEFVTGRTGSTTVVIEGIQLASAYDPQREAGRVVEDVLAETPDIIVVIGFGLGHTIEAIRERSAVPIVVYEPSPPRMRAALGARKSLTLFGDRQIDFASTPEALFQRMEGRYLPGLRVQIHIHPPLLELDPDMVRNAVQQISRAKDYVDASVGTRVRDLGTWVARTMQNAGLLMQNPSIKELFGRFRGLPVVVVSAGPSLDKQLETLARYRDRVLVISIGQALGALRSAGIEPDLVHILESQDVSHQLSRVGSSDNVNLVVTTDVSREVLEAPVRSCFVATPASDKAGRWIARILSREGWVFGGSTVAHGAVSLACALGAGRIFLIGQDLAYTDGRHYAKGSAYDDVKIRFDEDGFSEIDSRGRAERLGSRQPYVPRKVRVVWVDGWHGEKVPTSPSYAGFIDGYRALGIACELHGSKVVNCTEGGAYIEGLEHTSFAEALEEHARAPIDAADVIYEAYDAYQTPEASVFDDEVSRAQSALKKIDARAQKGVDVCRKTLRELARTHAPQRKIDLLRRLGKLEKGLRATLLEMPWIDSVVQPELNTSAADVRRDGNLEATPEQAVKEARFLFEATQKGVERAKRLLRFCAESVAGKRDFTGDHLPEVQTRLDTEVRARGEEPSLPFSGGQAAG